MVSGVRGRAYVWVACTRVRVFTQVTCVGPEGFLSTCQRCIGFLAGPEHVLR